MFHPQENLIFFLHAANISIPPRSISFRLIIILRFVRFPVCKYDDLQSITTFRRETRVIKCALFLLEIWNGVCKIKTIYKRICTHIWVSLFRSFSSSSKIMHSHRFGSALDFWLEGPKVRYLFSSWIRFYDLIIWFSFCWRKGILNIYTGFALLSKHLRWIMNTKSVAFNLYHHCNIAFLLASPHRTRFLSIFPDNHDDADEELIHGFDK